MVSKDQTTFDTRLRNLSRKHEDMSNGFTASLRSDGLIVVHPRKARPGLGGRAILTALLIFTLFKGVALAGVGQETYSDRLARMAQGSMPEQIGAWVLQIDPVSGWIGDKLRPYLR